jgi:hypothetical protein
MDQHCFVMKKLFYLFNWLALCLGLVSRPQAVVAQSSIYGITQILPGGKMAIYGSLSFVNGYVNTPRTLPNDNISFQDGSSYSGASDLSHVNGYAEKVGSTPFLFPVGNGITLRPVGVQVQGAATTVQAAYFNGNPGGAALPTGAPFSTTALGAGVGGVSKVEYWDVNGATPVSLTLTWNLSNDLNALTSGDLNDLIVVGWDGTAWQKLGSGTPVVTGSLSSTGTISVSTVTPNTYLAITFGTGAPVGTGTIDCAKTMISPAPVSGTVSQSDLAVTVNVTQAGTFPLTISGSGMSLANGTAVVRATTTGIQTFHIPVKYDGSTLGTMNLTVGASGSCSANLTTPPKAAIGSVWTLDCVPIAGPALK